MMNFSSNETDGFIAAIWAFVMLGFGLGIVVPESAEAIQWDVEMRETFQFFEADNSNSDKFDEQDPGFTQPSGDLVVSGSFQGVEGFFKLTNESADHPGIGFNFDYGFITFTDLTELADIRLGNWVPSFANPYTGGHDGPTPGALFIGERPTDFFAAVNGIQFIGNHGNFSYSADWGTPNFASNFEDDRGWLYSFNGEYDFSGFGYDGFSLFGAAQFVDSESEDAVTLGSPAVASPENYLFDPNSGDAGNGVGNLGSVTKVTGPGKDVTAYMFAGNWDAAHIPFSLSLGWTSYEDEDPDANGNSNDTPEQEWNSYYVQGRYDFTPQTTIGVRWETVENETESNSGIEFPVGDQQDPNVSLSPTSGNDELDRLQVALRHEFAEGVWLNAEWVSQNEDSGANLTELNRDFDGFALGTTLQF